jgi:hypothetical protein
MTRSYARAHADDDRAEEDQNTQASVGDDRRPKPKPMRTL